MPDPQLMEFTNPNLHALYMEFLESSKLSKYDKTRNLLGHIDLIIDKPDGVQQVYKMIGECSREGIFEGSPWADPTKLVPSLVNGTLKSGHPNSTLEILSELRILAIAKGEMKHQGLNPKEAESFIQEVIVSNLEFVFKEPLEETRLIMTEHELKKVHALFQFLYQRSNLDNVKEKLAMELTMICAQRPVVTEKQRKIIAFVKEKIDLDPDRPEDRKLLKFQRNIYRPTKNTVSKDLRSYRELLDSLSKQDLKLESREMGKTMLEFGLVSQYHAVLLLYLIDKSHFSIVPDCLGLNPSGRAKWNEYKDFVAHLIVSTIHPFNAQCVYGLGRMLEIGVFSRDAVRSSLYNLGLIQLHQEVEARILKSTKNSQFGEVSARQYLMGAVFRILGQPLGVGQGYNPTCQSARGISMWSQHAPAKLINMVQTAATFNDISFRFEGKEIKASETGKGLVQNLDYNLDAVSVTLVPMLDRVYNEMMLRASGRAEDPHKWVNPALYGQWIQIGFASAYDYLYNAIVDFDGFISIFYAMCHPDYNGGHRLIYPNPIGIFITSAKGEMLGFHAVSLLRVDRDPKNQLRAYFVNPNNEGRQDWGQNIKPSVYENNERFGESSLPLHEFAARIYAFHFNRLEATDKSQNVPLALVETVKILAKDSWGKSYVWLENKKIW